MDQPDISCFVNNPDISGIGVRVSFYLQVTFLVILVDRSLQDASSALWTCIASALGLTISAIAQTASNQLSLFQAVQISNLVWLLDFAIFFAQASYARKNKEARKKNKSVAKTTPYELNFYVDKVGTAQILVSMTLTVYMWANASDFGLRPECNSTIKYVLFIPVSVLGPGRKVALSISCAILALYIFMTFKEQYTFFFGGKTSLVPDASALPMHHIPSSPQASLAPPESVATPTGRTRSGSSSSNTTIIIVSPNTLPGSPNGSEFADIDLQYKGPGGKAKHKRPKKRAWHSFTDTDPILAGIMLFLFLILAYFIYSTETLLKINPASDRAADSDWGFGQVLAMVVVAPSALSLISALKTNGLRPVRKDNIAKQKSKTKGQRRLGRPITERVKHRDHIV